MTRSEAAARAGSLNQRQRGYLRLVAQGMTSKQIAQSVRGSHHTINTEIAVAMRLLGAKSRHEAAAIVEQAGSPCLYEPSSEPRTLAEPGPQQSDSIHDEGEANEDSGWALPVATRQQTDNMLTTKQRVAWVLVIAASVALLMGGLVSGIATLLMSLDRLI